MAKIDLNKMQDYEIRLYPGQIILEGKYINQLGGTHIFEHEKKGEKYYILVENHWMIKEEEIITHKDISSFQIKVIPERNAYMVKGLQKLIENDKN